MGVELGACEPDADPDADWDDDAEPDAVVDGDCEGEAESEGVCEPVLDLECPLDDCDRLGETVCDREGCCVTDGVSEADKLGVDGPDGVCDWLGVSVCEPLKDDVWVAVGLAEPDTVGS